MKLLHMIGVAINDGIIAEINRKIAIHFLQNHNLVGKSITLNIVVGYMLPYEISFLHDVELTI